MVLLQIIPQEGVFLLAQGHRIFMLMKPLGVVFLAVLLVASVTIKTGLVFLIAHLRYLDISWT